MRPSPSFAEFPRAALDGSVPARFTEIARRHPGRLAVTGRGQALTYDGLERAASRLARAILARRGPEPEPVALLVDHDAQAITAVLAVLKTGKFCAVLDSGHPSARLAAVLDDLGTRLILHAPGHEAHARALAGHGRGLLDADHADGMAADGPLEIPITPRALAYVSYTTGITGAPKGVLADHRGVIHRAMTFANSLQVGPDDRLTVFHGLGVSAAFRQLWGGLLTGATVCPLDLRHEGTGPIADWLLEAGITLAHFPASAFRHFANGLGEGRAFPAVRAVTLSNEPVLPSDLALFRRHFARDAVFVVMLGATEAGNVSQHVIDATMAVPADGMPIGYPLPDKEILLLGEDGRPLEGEAVGEIAVRSDFLAPGYWQRPELDRAMFLPDPEGGTRRIYRTGDLGRRQPNGAFVHLGRKDAVPKLRGRFVDTLEVERRLSGHPSVSETAVTVREDRPGDQRLVAYVVPTRAPAPTGPELRRFARETLPAHMVPSLFVMLPALPRTANGKVDRPGLPAPGRARPALDRPAVAPRTSLEQVLATIWADALGLEPIGVEDDFFDLGGHSLLAAGIANQVREALGVEVSLAALLDAGTVARMATRVVEAMLAAMPPDARVRLVDELGEPEARAEPG